MARARQKLEEEGSDSSSLVAQSAFSVMMGAQLARQRVSSEMTQAQEELRLLRSRLAATEERMEERRLGLGPKKLRAAEAEWDARIQRVGPRLAENMSDLKKISMSAVSRRR